MTKLKNSYEVLRAARKLIRNRKNWCRQVYSRAGAAGQMRYCAIGAVRYLPDPISESSRSMAVRLLGKALPESYSNVASFNDHRRTTHEDVLKLYDRAIRLAKDRLRAA